jgi:arylsulfatase A-like enzyme
MMTRMRSDDREPIGPQQDRQVTRRTFLKGGLALGGLLVGAGLAMRAAAGNAGSTTSSERSSAGAAPALQGAPNILVIVVDQLRFPQWLAPPAFSAGLPPNLASLSSGAVSFGRHYTASNDCTPARSTLLTGLYTHQTGCMITGGSTLDTRFPTWGKMLREHGYETRWYGKWHLTHHDNRWTRQSGRPALERYGFAGGTFPSPDGAPGQGWRVDPHVTQQFAQWYARHGESTVPWCTTVSFVNPHDIAWWYVWSKRVAAEASAPSTVARLPPNFETPEEQIARRKPQLQRSLQATAATSFGPVPFHGANATSKWLEFASLYVKLQMQVDEHIGSVLEALQSKPEVAANTVVVFTSDHGEYAGSHGLRGKGASAYEEAIRVPLIVKDPRGKLTAAPEQVRGQLSSSVDVAPLLLTIATGSNTWREDPRYAHLARRLDLAAILADPNAPGRPYVLHATDEVVTEFAIEPYAAAAPLHVIALRTAQAKYTTYTHWAQHSSEPIAQGAETELYDYSTHEGRLELDNVAGHSELEPALRHQLERATVDELREPLPPSLHGAHEGGFADYFSTARRSARGAAAARKVRSERVVGRLPQGDTGGTRAPSATR